jgi:hypothetical protein
LYCSAPALSGLVIASLVWVSRRWGATNGEIAKPLPRDARVPAGRQTTFTTTIDAAPDGVWPWLVRLGRGRGGFYTYTWIERILGAGIDNLDHIDPHLQSLSVGDGSG